jgi:hypothetical protein
LPDHGTSLPDVAINMPDLKERPIATTLMCLLC